MARRNSNQGRTLGIESLESRMLLAGNVAVAIQNHSLAIAGDKQDNNIQIEQVSRGQFTITGLNGTLINGKATPQSFTGITKDLNIDLKEGNDTLLIGTGATKQPTVTVQGKLNIKLGDGNDKADLNVNVNGDLSVNAGAGNDSVSLWKSKIGATGGNQNANIDMGSGRDGFYGFEFNIAHDLNVKTAGNSLGLTMNIDPGAVGHDFNIQTGNGIDDIGVYATPVGHKLSIKTNGGNDKVYLGGDVADQIFADLGNGDDSLVFGNNTARTATFDGNSGSKDTVELVAMNPNHFQSSTIKGFEAKIGFPPAAMNFVAQTGPVASVGEKTLEPKGGKKKSYCPPWYS